MSVDREREPRLDPPFESYSKYLTGLPTKWVASRIDGLRRGLQSGWLTQRRWANQTGDVAWAILDRSSDRGARIHALQFDRSSKDSLRNWTELIDRSDVGPIYAVVDLLEGLDEELQRRIFEPRGFRERRMIRMVWAAGSSPPKRRKNDQFRDFVPEDWPAFASLYQRVYDEPQGDYWLQPSANVQADAGTFFDQFIDPTGSWSPRVIRGASLVFEVEGKMVGNLLASRSESGTCHISGLMVDPEYRSRGIGTALLERALVVALEVGAVRVDLTAIRGTEAHRLYKRLGFQDLTGPEEILPGYWIRPSHRPV
ncbi:MAG: GNAT family N-acetyltransferase [Thermoplasmata archaeon]